MAENFFKVGSILEATRNSIDAELKDCGDDLLEKAKELAPEKSGRLKRSGYTKYPEDEFHPTANYRSREVGFDTRKHALDSAGSSFNYALIRHEIPSKTTSNGQVKFLETPYKANADKYEERVLKVVTEELGKINFGKIEI